MSSPPPPPPNPPPEIADTTFTLISAIIVSIIPTVVILILWQVARGRKFTEITYKPKKLLQEEKRTSEDESLVVAEITPPNPGLIGIFKQMWSMPEEEFVSQAGLDAAVFVRIMSFSVKLFSAYCIVGVVIAIINVTDDNLGGNADSWNNAITMANIEEESSRMWLHAISAWVYTAIWGFLLIKFHREVLALRNKNMSNSAGVDAYSVLVQEIPKEQKDIEGYFRKMYGSLVTQVVSVEPGIAKVDSVYNNAKSSMEKIENFIAHKAEIEADPSNQKEAEKLPKIEEKLAKEHATFSALKIKLIAEQHAARERKRANGSKCAFVTFTTRAAAASATRTLCHLDASQYVIRPAGKPTEVLWGTGNVEKGFWEVKIRTALAAAVVVFMVFFNAIPIAAIQLFVNEVPKHLPGWLEGVASGFIGGLGLVIFLAILPPVFRLITKMSGIAFVREQDRGVSHKYFTFLLFCVFLGSAVTSAITENWEQIVDDKNIDVVTTAIGNSVPTSSDYFISFVLIKTLIGWPVMLLDPVKIIVTQLKLKILAKTAKAKAAVWAPEPIKYDILGPTQLLVFTIGMAFSTIAPIALVFVVLYFAFGMVVFRYKTLFVFQPIYESEGQMWPHYTRRMFWGVLLYQVVLSLVMAAKKGPATAIMFPLIICTIVFNKLTTDKFKPAYQVIPRDVSCELDLEESLEVETDETKSPYFPPCMRDVGYLVPAGSAEPDAFTGGSGKGGGEEYPRL
mmetsp:Transcript_43601/g.139077  ORF Transcript_43601/g.139077 Transcript_43601/m.139077 type:complete len:736 (+) Transcript_43601:159-2366(+)|eukprot:CAMPEP_0182887030 /NCGR_PEP_ID=MMETSP0034_2-20130328/20572_1 /TAXON_ID=156128 /ORGANISM="Nephroselmis pyriformis, Strain CCMP717" /LENGTH=735 /DNA_ID=CAMNT_0025020375 /DNA_START=91 /DNA_END=2298 /DNA_ORIENTATION=+